MNTLLSPELSPMPTQTLPNDYQPVYPDPDRLQLALNSLREMPGITSPDRIKAVRANLALLAMSTSQDGHQLFVTGACEREIVDLHETAEHITSQQEIVAAIFPGATHVSRDLVQDKKPRSEDFEDAVNPKTGEVVRVMTYRGSGIHGREIDARDPDPKRLVRGMERAQAVSDKIPELISFHEALLVPFEQSMTRIEQGHLYVVSGDILGIGDRTRFEGSPQLKLLKNVENPVSIKIGPTATPDDIKMLEQTLNPQHQPGKTMFTLRLGVEHLAKADSMVKAIKKFAPGSLIICDPMHGNTVKTLHSGETIKTRYTDDMVREIIAVLNACNLNGMKLHGLHLEASGRINRLECVKNSHEIPKHNSVVDPQLNNAQLREILTIYHRLLKA